MPTEALKGQRGRVQPVVPLSQAGGGCWGSGEGSVEAHAVRPWGAF